MILRLLRNLFRRKPKPEDYIGTVDIEGSLTMLASKTLKDCLMRKKKREELEIIRELHYEDKEPRRIP